MTELVLIIYRCKWKYDFRNLVDYVCHWKCVVPTRPSRLRNRCVCFRIRLYASQHKSTKSWKRLDGLSPPLMTYAMSEVKTNGARSLNEPHDHIMVQEIQSNNDAVSSYFKRERGQVSLTVWCFRTSVRVRGTSRSRCGTCGRWSSAWCCRCGGRRFLGRRSPRSSRHMSRWSSPQPGCKQQVSSGRLGVRSIRILFSFFSKWALMD